LRPGEVGLVHARAGVGKTGLLVRLALEKLLRGEPVLHVACRDSIEIVRDTYESIFTGLNHGLRPLERAEALLHVERHRVIHATRGAIPRAVRIDELLRSLQEVMEYTPALVVIDGLEAPPDELAALKEIARAREVAIWVANTPQKAVPFDAVDLVLELVPERAGMWVHVRKLREEGAVPVPVRLEGASFVAREDEVAPDAAAGPLRAHDCTLYSGGAHGAEAAFGEAAERFGVKEVNFTFTGHVQARTRGAHPLTEQELAAGEVSLAYVSRRLRRGYGEGTMIRRVLQSLWHQVRSAQIVFVIGAIQEDGTVTGGTGWSVELARMWNKRLWVFDQEKDGWFRWNGEDWVAGEPVIDAPTFCGTGTRYLSENGRVAIEALMERSFRPSAA
jgi:hypothetical protein